MKKLFFVITMALGGYALSSAQTATTASSPANAPKAACCQQGATGKACCSKDTKTASASGTQCSGHSHTAAPKAEAAAPAQSGERKAKPKNTTTKAS